MTRRVRVGIDVGGTFTKAVAIDVLEGAILGSVAVPTTHSSIQGVSYGILMALSKLMNESKIINSEIELISHSTDSSSECVARRGYSESWNHWDGCRIGKKECN